MVDVWSLARIVVRIPGAIFTGHTDLCNTSSVACPMIVYYYHTLGSLRHSCGGIEVAAGLDN